MKMGNLRLALARIRRTWVLMTAIGALMALSYCAGRDGTLPRAAAAPPAPTAAEPAADSAHRWVAVIYGNIPVTREELGEYLIARHSDKLELLVNKRIIEHECKEKGIEVTAAEVDAALAEDLKGMGNLPLKEFVDKVLKRYNKTLFEWKEDVLRPKLLMAKLSRDRIHASEKDFQDAFESYYGEKVECRIILFPKGEEKRAMMAYAKLRDSEEDFDREARHQASPTLAANGGKIRPISHHSTGNDELEKEAFSLQPGEVSRLIGTPEGSVYVKCDKRVPADATKKLANERAALEKEILEKKTQQELPKIFKELQDKAQPKLFLKKYITEAELERDVKQEVESIKADSEGPRPPHAN